MNTVENLRTPEMVEWYLFGYMGYLITYGQKDKNNEQEKEKDNNRVIVSIDDDKLESVGSSLSATVQKNPRLDRDLIPNILYKWLTSAPGTTIRKLDGMVK